MVRYKEGKCDISELRSKGESGPMDKDHGKI